MAGRHYRRRIANGGDPYWLDARFASRCACGKAIKTGERVFYYPRERKVVCESCGHTGENALRAEMSMDRFGTDCAYDY